MNNENNKEQSYTAANIMPSKLIKQKSDCFRNKKIIPYHVQICPTNTCNLNCSFCSCSNREKKQKIDHRIISKIAYDLFNLGTKAVTITGGGEPCCYGHFDKLLSYLSEFNIKMGLVSNGLLLHKHLDSLNKLTWCRVSASDERCIDSLINVLSHIVPKVQIDWAISYVITKSFNIDKFSKIINFANKYKFTHVRAVSDLMDLENVPSMNYIKNEMKKKGIDDSLVLYQDRKDYEKGVKECAVSLLRPVLAPDGYIYPCCGVQYAIPKAEGSFPLQMRMCHISEFKTLIDKQIEFDGSVCDKCYYSEYNKLLNMFKSSFVHEEFV